MNAYLSVLKNYATFSGRASRNEFWMFNLINIIVYFALVFISGIIVAIFFNPSDREIGLIIVAILSSLFDPVYSVLVPSAAFILPYGYLLAVFLPSLAVTVRRLHDTNKSGWLILLQIIPFVNLVGWIILFVFYVTRGTVGKNDYGADPYDIDGQDVNLM